MKDLLKRSGKRELVVLEAVNEYLDEDFQKWLKFDNKTAASQKSISQMGFKIISTEIQIIDGFDKEFNTPKPYLCVGIVKLDGKYYACYYDLIDHEQYTEEVSLDVNSNIVESRLILDQTEWLVVTNFFNINNFVSNARIVNWIINYRTQDPLKAMKLIETMQWYKELKKKTKNSIKPLTTSEIYKKMLKAEQVIGNHQSKPGKKTQLSYKEYRNLIEKYFD